mmetsp:Transcript_46665/g.107092  ORF Transcript_46665/g.107092 Transcript_46665/m.107092 type:complete len:341 (+) Transcript_46665:486-1508(+)
MYKRRTSAASPLPPMYVRAVISSARGALVCVEAPGGGGGWCDRHAEGMLWRRGGSSLDLRVGQLHLGEAGRRHARRQRRGGEDALPHQLVECRVVREELRGVRVDQVDVAARGDGVDRLEDLLADGEGEHLGGEGAEGADLRELGLIDRREDALDVGAQLRLHRVVLEVGRHRRQRGEGGGVGEAVGAGGDGGVADARLGHRRPRALAAVHSAVDLDEHGAARLLLHLRVHAAALDAERVKHSEDVLDHRLQVRLFLNGHEAHAEVDEGRVVVPPLVVLPDGDALVHAVARDGVDDVLVAAEVLLQEHLFVREAQHVLRALQRLEAVAHLLLGVADGDAI